MAPSCRRRGQVGCLQRTVSLQCQGPGSRLRLSWQAVPAAGLLPAPEDELMGIGSGSVRLMTAAIATALAGCASSPPPRTATQPLQPVAGETQEVIAERAFLFVAVYQFELAGHRYTLGHASDAQQRETHSELVFIDGRLACARKRPMANSACPAANRSGSTKSIRGCTVWRTRQSRKGRRSPEGRRGGARRWRESRAAARRLGLGSRLEPAGGDTRERFHPS